ncbi:UTP--glucose-1-phosphate uridylyltransferase, partial [Xanthomonas vasicola]
AFRFEGRRFDCGAHIGLIEATVHFALEHEKHGGPAKEILRSALAQADARG